jgi:hypothetical protein
MDAFPDGYGDLDAGYKCLDLAVIKHHTSHLVA